MATETPREIINRCMPHAKYDYLDGALYHRAISPCMPTETYKKMSQLELSADDVYSFGWPRSGNHWTYYVLDMIIKQSATPTSTSFIDAFIEFMQDDQLNAFKAAPSPRLFVSHAKLRRFPDITRKNTRVIYVIRSPKDAMVSYYKILSNVTGELQFNGTWEDFFEAVLGGEIPWGTWFDHILDFEKFMADNPDVPVYIHQFEEMKQKPVECVKKLCSFLGKPDTLAKEIVASSTIDSLKTVIKSQTENNERFFKDKDPTFVRKGESGYWKNYFTVAQSERFDREFEKKMKDSNLADLVRQYI